MSNATVNRYMGALSTAISTAVKEWEWMEENPLRKVSKLKEPRGESAIFQKRNGSDYCLLAGIHTIKIYIQLSYWH